jgi:hypothetical protein
MTSAKHLVFILGLCVSLAACKSLLKKRLPVTEDSAAPVASAAPPPPPVVSAPVASAAPVAPPADDGAVPATEDFEDEAFEKVTTANFRTEFAKLSKDIGK